MKDLLDKFEAPSLEFCAKKYDEAKNHAQNDQWDEHLNVIKPVIVIYHIYGKKTKVARCLCRGAWSLIATKEYFDADYWLRKALEQDKEEGLAGLYWAIEYLKRFEISDGKYNDSWAQLFQKDVKLFLEEKNFSGLEHLNFSQLTVSFYKFLSQRKSPALSDVGRFHELHARYSNLTSPEKIDHFKAAARIYHNDNLPRYGNFCLLCANLESLLHANAMDIYEAPKKINSFIAESRHLLLDNKLDRKSTSVLEAICDLHHLTQDQTLPDGSNIKSLTNTLINNTVLSKYGQNAVHVLLNKYERERDEARYLTDSIFHLLKDFYASILRIY
jgi:hypothetical protein